MFGFKFPTSPLKPFALESPPLEALNDPHSHFDINVASSNNNVSIARRWLVHEHEA